MTMTVSSAVAEVSISNAAASPSKKEKTHFNVLDRDTLIELFKYFAPSELATQTQVCRKWNRFISNEKVWLLNVNNKDAAATNNPEIEAHQKKLLANCKAFKSNKFGNDGDAYYVTQHTFKHFPVLHPSSQQVKFKTIEQVVYSLRATASRERYNAMSGALRITQINREIPEVEDKLRKVEESQSYKRCLTAIEGSVFLNMAYRALTVCATGQVELNPCDVTSAVTTLMFYLGLEVREILNDSDWYLTDPIKDQRLLLVGEKDLVKREINQAISQQSKAETLLKKILAGDLFQTRQLQQ